MSIDEAAPSQLEDRFAVLLPHLNERQRRLAVATEARLLGHGGVRVAARAAGMGETTVRRGVAELEAGQDDPELVAALHGMIEPDERGDPESPLRWTTKSLRHLADELTRQGHRVSAPTVGRLLVTAGFSLQANTKTLEGAQHPDRDAQFGYLNDQAREHQDAGEPVISVDTKKREQLGRLPMAGREWRPSGEPVQVEDHHFFFTGPDVEQAIPYGIYDLARNTGWVNVGVDHDTSVFAVESIRRWWRARGRQDYPNATRLLITADAGGSNGYRYRVWKSELAALAAETGLAITVCHFPPGTSKWNKIEHRLFSHITHNWRARPLTSHDVVVKTIEAVRTRGGLRVEAALDTGDYPTGVAISKERFAALPLQRHTIHEDWNYTLRPEPQASDAAVPIGEQGGPAERRRQMLTRLADPRLTGLSVVELDALAVALAPAQAARAQQRFSEQRGGRARRATGKLRATPLFDDPARLLLTLLYQRQVCSMSVLADLLEVSFNAVSDLVGQTREVLEDHGHDPGFAAVRFTTTADLIAFLDHDTPPARSAIIDTLSDPANTGISRDELRRLIERLAPRQAAQAERLAHQRRGGPRQGGARGGVFPQKISNGERVLLTLLHLRKRCTLDALADALGDVSRSLVGMVVRETQPLLEHHGDQLPPTAPIRYRTAAELLDTPTG
jgi:hypothetical protein